MMKLSARILEGGFANASYARACYLGTMRTSWSGFDGVSQNATSHSWCSVESGELKQSSRANRTRIRFGAGR